jgi:hypothetical protein
MNERIDELLWQAGGYTKLSYPNDTFLDGRYALTQLQLDKFAELIVRECMDIAKQVENDKFEVAGSAEPEYRKGINDGRRNAAWGIKNRMKLHFGVEE